MPDAGSSVSRSLGMSVPRAKRFGMYREQTGVIPEAWGSVISSVSRL